MVTDFPQQPASIAQAKKVSGNPELYAHKPHLFMASWSILKSARGQPIRQYTVVIQHHKRCKAEAIQSQAVEAI